MKNVTITGHAVERFRERFAGNLGEAGARERLGRLLRRARFVAVCPGHARLYAVGEMRLVVQDGALVTVYRLRYTPAPPAEDLWCAA